MTGVARTGQHAGKVAKVSISLPEELLEAVDDLVRTRAKTRSELIREAVERLLRAEEDARLEAQYAAGYRSHPEDDAEARAAEVMAAETAGCDPWEVGEVGDETRGTLVGAARAAARP
jgi:Arc/MetJ-type ribon-helix-helix transcriptional regulator